MEEFRWCRYVRSIIYSGIAQTWTGDNMIHQIIPRRITELWIIELFFNYLNGPCTIVWAMAFKERCICKSLGEENCGSFRRFQMLRVWRFKQIERECHWGNRAGLLSQLRKESKVKGEVCAVLAILSDQHWLEIWSLRATWLNPEEMWLISDSERSSVHYICLPWYLYLKKRFEG